MNIGSNPSEERSLFSDLNREQESAVCTTNGPLLVLAGAGTGKTLVITRRIAYLLSRRIAAENILAVTFTRKAANEMRERLSALVGQRARNLTISTFHSLGLRMLKEHGYKLSLSPKLTIVNTEEQLRVIEGILDFVDPEGKFSAMGLLTRISAAKNRGVTPEAYLRRDLDADTLQAVTVYARYEAELRRRGALDLDDLLALPLTLLTGHQRIRNVYLNRFRYILVDEYQDTNRIQYLFTHQLVGPERNLCAVGDDDQSIYRFRGAEIGNILRFEEDFAGAKAVTLERNYRCTEPIIALANSVIQQSKTRYNKRLISNVGPGVPVRWRRIPHEEAETEFILDEIKRLVAAGFQYSDIAILHRVRAPLLEIRAALQKQSLPCLPSENGVITMTLHQAKGLEFPVVLLPAVEEDMLPHFRAVKEGVEALEEERRLLYVGITRAKRLLIITSAASRGGHEREPSRFLRQVSRTGVLNME